MTQLFVACIDSTVRKADGSFRFDMNYKIKGKRVCRKAFSIAYGISGRQLDNISKHLKMQVDPSEGRLPDNVLTHFKVNHRPFNDETIPDYTYCGVEGLFMDNLKVSSVGTNNNNIYCTLFMYL